MYTVTYYKIGNRWFLDLPEHIEQGGDAEDLERFGHFHDFLDLAAAGATTVFFHMDVHPFDGADFLEFTGDTGEKTGGYYRLKSFEGQPVDLELWFNSIIYKNQPQLPQRIYIKRIK